MNATTYGAKAVGLSFNPSNNLTVHELKTSAAGFIDRCRGIRADNDEVRRMVELAITRAQEAQMWAVKAATWEE